MWFNDDIRYNRRTGVTLDLIQGNHNKSNEYKFDSRTDPENRFNTVIDNFYAPHDNIKYAEEDYPNPLEIPMWPKESMLPKICPQNNARQRKLYHTTEIHTFFEYTKTEKFDFRGDDDVWVFINGQLAIDVSGVHHAAGQFIDLSRDAAAEHFNLTVGETYTFDMFQAERQCQDSNFEITTTLAAPCNAANELNSKKQFDAATDMIPSKVKTSRSVVLKTDGSFDLTVADNPFASSYLWLKEPVNVGTGFVINFNFKVSDLTEGFAFVLHRRNQALSNLPFSSGANLGFRGLENSLAIAFDLCKDRAVHGTSCKEQRVSIHTTEPGQTNGPTDRTLKVYDSVLLSLKDNQTHHVKLEYFVIPPALEVTIDGSLYLRQMPINPTEVFQSRAAFVGFTASNGNFIDASVTISGFTVFAVDVEASTTKTVDFPGDRLEFATKQVLADGQEADGFSVQTYDGCDKLVAFGGRLQNTKGIFIERIDSATGLYSNGSRTPVIVPADIEDEDTGEYKYTLRTQAIGTYDLHLYYGNPGEDCHFDLNRSVVPINGALLEVIDVTHQGNERCFFASIEQAIEMVPLTKAPTTSPTQFLPVLPESQDASIYVAGIGGGMVVVLASIAGTLVIVYKRRWQQDMEFAADGAMYKLGAHTELDPNSKHGTIGMQLLASRAAILRLRAQRGKEMADISKLQNDQDELMEQITTLRKRIAARESLAYGSETIPEPIKRTTQRLEM